MLKRVEPLFLVSLFLFLIFSVALFNKSVMQEIAHSYKWVYLYLCFPIILIINRIKVSPTSGIGILFLAVFIVAITISTLTSDYLDAMGLKYLLGYSTLFLLASYIPFSLNQQKNSDYLFYGIYLTSLICILLSFFLIGSSSGWGNGRFSGVFHNPNALGSIATICAICSFVSFTSSRKKFYLFLYFLALVALILVQSRNSYLTLILVTIFILIKQYKLKALLYLSSLIVIFMLASQLIAKIQSENFTVRKISVSVDSARQDIFSRHIELFLEKPIFGQGLSEGDDGGRFPAELAYTDILSFSGVIGSWGFLMAILVGLYKGYRTHESGKLSDEGNFYVFVVILIMSAADGYISNIGNPLPIFAWLYLGTVYRLK